MKLPQYNRILIHLQFQNARAAAINRWDVGIGLKTMTVNFLSTIVLYDTSVRQATKKSIFSAHPSNPEKPFPWTTWICYVQILSPLLSCESSLWTVQLISIQALDSQSEYSFECHHSATPGALPWVNVVFWEANRSTWGTSVGYVASVTRLMSVRPASLPPNASIQPSSVRYSIRAFLLNLGLLSLSNWSFVKWNLTCPAMNLRVSTVENFPETRNASLRNEEDTICWATSEKRRASGRSVGICEDGSKFTL